MVRVEMGGLAPRRLDKTLDIFVIGLRPELFLIGVVGEQVDVIHHIHNAPEAPSCHVGKQRCHRNVPVVDGDKHGMLIDRKFCRPLPWPPHRQAEHRLPIRSPGIDKTADPIAHSTDIGAHRPAGIAGTVYDQWAMEGRRLVSRSNDLCYLTHSWGTGFIKRRGSGSGCATPRSHCRGRQCG